MSARRVPAIASLTVFSVLATLALLVTPASAATLNVGPSDVYASKTYYSTPRYKATTGTISMKVTSVANLWGGSLKTGLRTSVGVGESTQFPVSNIGVSVGYLNIYAPPAQSQIFASGYYYYNAQLSGVFGSDWTTWSGTVTW